MPTTKLHPGSLPLIGIGTSTGRVSISHLAERAGLKDPASFGYDGDPSPGAAWLLELADDVQAAWLDRDRDRQHDLHECLWRTVAVAVEAPTHFLWTVFVDLSAWQFDLADEGYGPTLGVELPEVAGTVLGLAAQRLATSLWTEWLASLR